MNIIESIEKYLESVKLARSHHTHHAYKNAMNNFIITLGKNGVNPQTTSSRELNEEAIVWFANDLKIYTPTSEQLYITAVKGFYEFLAAENLNNVNLPKLKLLIRQRTRRPGKRLPQFPANAISNLIENMLNKNIISNPIDPNEILRELRDRAFLVTLADTGLRVHEACALRLGSIDWNEGKAIVIGKGDKQAIIRFSQRSLKTLREYIDERGKQFKEAHRQISAEPLFARHDKGAGKKIKPITPTTGRNIVAERVREVFGLEAVGKITPHSFRHFFVTRILSSTGNLKLAQSLARHQNIAVTQRYAHLSDDELDKGYINVFDSKG